MDMPSALVLVARAIGSALVMAIGSVAPALGVGNAVCKALEGIARQPEASSELRTTMILGCAITESTGIYSFIIALLLLFVFRG